MESPPRNLEPRTRSGRAPPPVTRPDNSGTPYPLHILEPRTRSAKASSPATRPDKPGTPYPPPDFFSPEGCGQLNLSPTTSRPVASPGPIDIVGGPWRQ